MSCLAIAACGNRISHQQLLADARAESGTGAVSPASGPGAVVGVTGTGTPSQATGGANAPPGSAIAATPSGSSATGASQAGSAANAGQLTTSGQPSGPAAPATATCTTPGSTITIGSVGEQSGLVGASVYAGVQAVQAWVTATNAVGGLDCHPVRYVVLDDGGDPSRNQTLTQQLVEQDHAIALVYVDAPFAGQASVNYLTAKHIPVIGSETGEDWFYSHPYYFPQVSSGAQVLEAAIAAAAEVGIPEGKTKLATFSCVEASICSQLYALGPTWAPKFGLKLVYRGQGSIAEPDYTAGCQAAQQAGAQILYIGLDASSLIRMMRSCVSINYRPMFLTASSSAGTAVLAQDGSDGMVVGMTALPFMVTSNAGVVEFQNTLARYAPGVPPSVPAITGWIAAKLFELAVEDGHAEPSSQEVLNGLWAIHGNTLGGLTGPLDFAEGQNPPRTLCYWVMEVEHQQFVSPNGSAGKCIAP
jgi:branched-chain amino acid transport system substrate-binding protein